MRWIKAKHSPIGVDLSGRSVSAVQLTREGASWRVRASITVRDIAVLPEALERHNFRGNQIILSPQPEQLHAEVLDLPPRASGAPLQQIAHAEMARAAKMEHDPFEMACWDLPAPSRGAAGTAVMAVAFRHQHAEPLLDLLQQHGLEVRAIDVPACALARALAPSTEKLTAILNLAWDAALLVLVHRGVVLYQRLLPEGAVAALHAAVATHFAVDADVAEHILVTKPDQASDWLRQLIHHYVEALSTELHASLSYSARRYPQLALDRLVLAGEGAAIAGLHEILAEHFEAPVALSENPKLATAIGLAQYEE